MNWYLEVLKKYTVFTGRSRRQEYWMFFLVNVIILFVLQFIDRLLGMPGILGSIYGLAVLLPGIGVSIRRLHDTDRSGWMLLLALIPLVGAIILIVFLATDGTAGSNKFGENPKQA